MSGPTASISRQVVSNVILARAQTRFPERPDRFYRGLFAMAPWGVSLPGVVAAGAARFPDEVAIVDDDGAVSYGELWRRCVAIAGALGRDGIGPGSVVGVLSFNSRMFVEAAVGAAAVGADIVFLNTAFAGPQIEAVAATEKLDVLLHDRDSTAAATSVPVRRYDAPAIAAMSAAGGHWLRPPRRPGRLIILTSGTTGHPKGAARRGTGTSVGAAALLGRVPLRARDRNVIAAPLFHGWGLSGLLVSLSLGATAIVQRKFDPAVVVASVAAHRATGLIVVPVMLQRILALPTASLVEHDTSSLRIIACSGSALPGSVATEALNRFGRVLYSVYGSTEVAVATVATPADLRRSPTTAGRPAPGVTVRVLDDDGLEAAANVVGHVFVGNAAAFDGYTSGGDKERHGGVVSSGDLGHFDEAGFLYIDGREDEMIVSGGENVFPGEVEELLSQHPAIAEVAVVGVPNEEFGQVLAAFVVRKPDTGLTANDVRTFVREHLARFKVPKSVTFLDALPRTSTGKVLKRSLV